MRNVFGLVLGVALMASGCATLQSQGVLTPEQSKALCVDALTACAAAGAVNASPDVQKYCAAIAVVCGTPVVS